LKFELGSDQITDLFNSGVEKFGGNDGTDKKNNDQPFDGGNFKKNGSGNNTDSNKKMDPDVTFPQAGAPAIKGMAKRF
jgi:hypothetical protein